ncbi:FeoB small GTPase domain-containing protein [Candidatus Omnitrophota bacterium]
MKEILLIGNPNVGKSAVFSRLTGARVTVSNYPGTTVEFTQGFLKLQDEKAMVIDVPGTYSLHPTSKAEEVAVQMLKEGSIVINVLDATNLERNLYLTLQLLEKNIPVVVALNIWDDTKHRGIEIDVERLEQALGVPVIPTCALTGEGIHHLIARLPEARSHARQSITDAQRWQEIGKIVEEVQRLHHRHHTLLEILADLSIKPLTGLPIALAVIFSAFQVIRFIGEGLISNLCEPAFENLWLPLMSKFSLLMGSGGLVHDILIGRLIEGQIDLGLSFGLLTTGLFVPLAMVLPYIVSFYFVLGLLEDFGYLPRLAVLVDNVMHHLGLHGYAVVPMILGLGCNVPGALAVRLLEGRREKFIAATLMAIAVPCIAQIAMIVGLVGQRGGQYVAIIFLVLILIWFFLGAILHRILKGESPALTLEIPPYRIPQLAATAKKLWMRTEAFLISAVPYVLLGIMAVNILYTLKIIDFLAGVFSPLFTGLWGLPAEAISALLVGFLRKDVAIGMLGPLNLTTKQLVVGSTILAIYFPCVATFIVLIRELGIKDMFKSALIMLLVALSVGGLLNFFLPPNL